jgi:hypothetical protein
MVSPQQGTRARKPQSVIIIGFGRGFSSEHDNDYSTEQLFFTASRAKFDVSSNKKTSAPSRNIGLTKGALGGHTFFSIGKIYQQPNFGGNGVSPPAGLSPAFLGLPGRSAADCGAVASSELFAVCPTLSFLRQRLTGDWLFALPPTLLLAGLAVSATGDDLRGLFYCH